MEMVGTTGEKGEHRRAGAHLPSTLPLDCKGTLQILPWGWRGEEGEIKAFPPKSAEAKAPNFLFPLHSETPEPEGTV